MGFFNVDRLMAARAETSAGGNCWRLWALGPILLLARRRRRLRHRGLLARRSDRPQPAARRRRSTSAASSSSRARSGSASRIRSANAITIASVTVDDAIVPFTRRRAERGQATPLEHDRRPVRLGRRTIRSTVGVTSSTGIETTKEIAAAVETPTASAKGFLGYGLIGFLVGVVPVALGLLWLPSLRRADQSGSLRSWR